MSRYKEELMYRVLTLPVSVDINPLSYYLSNQGIVHKVTEESGSQVVWTNSPDLIDPIKRYYYEWESGSLNVSASPRTGKIKEELSSLLAGVPWFQTPVTMVFIVVSIIVAVISLFGEALTIVQAFSFLPFQMVLDGMGGQRLYFGTVTTVLDQGEFWRFITPIFLHFSIVHLSFNMLWVFNLGQRIETRLSGWHLFVLVLITGVAGNVAQHVWGGRGAFRWIFRGGVWFARLLYGT